MKIKLLLAALLLSLAANAVLYIEMRRMSMRVAYPSDLDRGIIERAWALRARDTGLSASDARRGHFPAVVVIRGWRCVSLQLERGWLGTEPVYCFDRQGRLTHSEQG